MYNEFRQWALEQGAEFPTTAPDFQGWVADFLNAHNVQGRQRAELFDALCQEGGAPVED